jgi:NAD+ synthase (glutamine-hydrolysing)
MDFDGNEARVLESIRQAKAAGATYRLGPELEISGYSCEDHFLELDTFDHSDESLAHILASDATEGILCDIGCPVIFDGVRYNCRVFCLNHKVLLIRPKMFLADDGNYREKRFFSSWSDTKTLHNFRLSDRVHKATGGQTITQFGIGVIVTKETVVAAEVCEELWSAASPHTNFSLGGVEIIGNGSGSHHQLRKLNSRFQLIEGATSKCGGCYLYSNMRGCDGNRLYFDGSSVIYVNGALKAQAPQFSLKDVEVVTATVDLAEIRMHRHATASFQEQSARAGRLLKVDASYFALAGDSRQKITALSEGASPTLASVLHTPEEECALGPACWLWDYMRRAKAKGFMLPLSGGADSASVAAIVRIMCGLVVKEIASDEPDALCVSTAYNILGDELKKTFDTTVSERERGDILCGALLHTSYMGTENSSASTRNRAKDLAAQIGAYHNGISITPIVDAVLFVLGTITGKTPRYLDQGGSHIEDIALQNIQARLRMVMTYLEAQLLPWVRERPGFLLVLGSGNVDEALRGYMTKYDCSSADLNPIGGICKGDLKKMLVWASDRYEVPMLREIAEAKPSAELRPLAEGQTEDYSQIDEDDMGMTYEELGIFGSLRKIQRCGPVSMFTTLVSTWRSLAPSEVAAKVKRFFFYYAINRHKLTVLTPSYHAENYSPDDNRFDLRQILYNSSWTRQFDSMDASVRQLEEIMPGCK